MAHMFLVQRNNGGREGEGERLCLLTLVTEPRPTGERITLSSPQIHGHVLILEVQVVKSGQHGQHDDSDAEHNHLQEVHNSLPAKEVMVKVDVLTWSSADTIYC